MIRTIVFAGDSLTDARHREREFGPLGYGFVSALDSTLADGPWRLVNAGVAGNTIRDLQARWHDDVVQRHPAVVNILIGINDVWRRYSHDDPTSAEAYATVYREILTVQARASATLLLCEPFLIPLTSDQKTWQNDLDEKRAVVANLADEFGATFVPLHDALNADAVELGHEAITTDGVHLTPVGHRRLAEHWKNVAVPVLH